MENSYIIISGLLRNLMIMLLSSLLPAAVGVGMTFVMQGVKKSGTRLRLRVVSVIFYCFSPMLLMLCFFYKLSLSAMPALILALTVSHLGFFMICYDHAASVLKNIVVNFLGLLSSTFLWSLSGALVGYDELLHTANALTARTFETVYFVYGLAMAFAVLAAVNIPRMILKEKMR